MQEHCSMCTCWLTQLSAHMNCSSQIDWGSLDAQQSTTTAHPAEMLGDANCSEFDRHHDVHGGYEATGWEICQWRLTNCDTG
jgi:hypothetical protein